MFRRDVLPARLRGTAKGHDAEAIGLDHVSISVADLDRSLAFYRDLLGLPVLGRGEESGGDIETITGIANRGGDVGRDSHFPK